MLNQIPTIVHSTSQYSTSFLACEKRGSALSRARNAIAMTDMSHDHFLHPENDNEMDYHATYITGTWKVVTFWSTIMMYPSRFRECAHDPDCSISQVPSHLSRAEDTLDDADGAYHPGGRVAGSHQHHGALGRLLPATDLPTATPEHPRLCAGWCDTVSVLSWAFCCVCVRVRVRVCE